MPKGLVRLQRVLAAAGVAARRACEILIERGHVTVNGRVVRTLPAFVDPQADHIAVDGRPIPRAAPRKIYVMLNKPARVLGTTADDAEIARVTVLDLVDHPARARLVPVGRLDFQTAGLVLLTNDGELVNRLTHPRFGVPKTYHAVVKGAIDPVALAAIQGSLNRTQRKDDRRAGRVAPTSGQRLVLELVDVQPSRSTIRVTLREGRTGNIAKLLTAAGCPVRAIERVAIGPIRLTGVARGRWRELDRREIQQLRNAARGIPDTSSGPRAVRAGERPAPRRLGAARRARTDRPSQSPPRQRRAPR